MWRNRLINVVSFPKFTLSVEGTHVVEEDAALTRWHVIEIDVWACFPHGLWEDTSAIVKPCFCVGVFGGGTVRVFRVLSEVLYCSVFSNARIGNSFRFLRRHVTLSHRKPLIVILNWFSCLIRCSVRSKILFFAIQPQAPLPLWGRWYVLSV